MKHFIALLYILTLPTLAVAQDESQPTTVPTTVIELFSSQACSACPPADAALRNLRDKDGIIALTWPVDYWDRLGWADTHAVPMNAKRQVAYNKRMGISGVFTPQMIFNGTFQTVGSKKEAVKVNIEKSRAANLHDWSPILTIENDAIKVSLPKATMADMGSANSSCIIRIVFYKRDLKAEIGAGENRGRTLHYTNVVRSTKIIGEWKGDSDSLFLPLSSALIRDADHVAVLLQDGYEHGPIVGASKLSLKTES